MIGVWTATRVNFATDLPFPVLLLVTGAITFTQYDDAHRITNVALSNGLVTVTAAAGSAAAIAGEPG